MGCSGCSKNKKNVHVKGTQHGSIVDQKRQDNHKTVVTNLLVAGKEQPNKLKWFRDGVAGILKCIGNVSKYSDEEIEQNRDKCRNCEFSTKKNGNLHTTSQCMAPDPDNNDAPCGCFILCKTQSDDCPKGFFGGK